MLSAIRSLARNPLGISILAFATGVALLWLTKLEYLKSYVMTTSIAENIATSIIAASIFGVLFEYFSKITLIGEAVTRAVGQTRATTLGVSDIRESAHEISYREDLLTSSELIISARFSPSFLTRNKDDVLTRLKKKGKKMTFIRMSQNARVPGYVNSTVVEDSLRKIVSNERKVLDRISMMHSEHFLSYNFVKVDRGIWIKLYWNTELSETPPALFVERGSSLYTCFIADINRLMSDAKRVEL